MQKIKINIWKVIAGLFFLLISENSLATNYWEIPTEERALLPPFCTHGYARYNIKDHVYMNHLCPGLYALNDAQRQFENNKTKQYALQEAEDHLSYTLGHVQNFPFRSTVFIKRGTVYQMQGIMPKAIADYQEAIRIQPKNIHAYSALANAYLKMGNKTEAAEVIEAGLKIKPTSKMLLSVKKNIAGTK
ncbi:MAG: tetratricopeptide repeat protein [Methyloprofundus sp.]|nr:tetratricopeptide repeat protein [Methyloprofundus sp.]